MTAFSNRQRNTSRSRARPAGLSRRKRYGWSNMAAFLTQTGLGAQGTVLLNQGDLGDYTEPTLVRVRGELVVSVPALSPGSFYWAAMMVVQLDETGTPPGVNIFDQERSSLLWAYEGWAFDFGGGHRYTRIEIDAKSKRRIEGDEGLVFFIQTITAGTTVEFRFAARSLVQQV